MSLYPKSLSLVKPRSQMEDEILGGLTQETKSTPAKYLYDERGSELFEQICELEDYYPTRTENNILHEHAAEIGELIGPESVIVEPGAGVGSKVRILLGRLEKPAAYVPIEISQPALNVLLENLRREHPGLPVAPICGDFTRGMPLPPGALGVGRKRVVFFPGSTIGNFHSLEACAFLRECSAVAGNSGGLLIGVDLKKDPWVMIRAYDDSEGVTAEFNLNLLRRLNRELNANFDLGHFNHEALYNDRQGRMEMHLVSRVHQIVQVAGHMIRFRKGETIHTESSYKYSITEFSDLAANAGWALRRAWRDRNQMFGVFYFDQA